LQLFRTGAVQITQGLHHAFAEGDFITPAIDPVDGTEILIWLTAFEEEGTRRDIRDPNDLDEDLDWDEEH
jgi:hypothetical protein